MKFIILPILLLSGLLSYSQNRINPHEVNGYGLRGGLDLTLANDTTYDVRFYHLDLEIAVGFPYLSGSVGYILKSNIDGLNSLQLDLDDAFSIDSVSSPATGYSFSENVLTVYFEEEYDTGDLITFRVHYRGAPVLAGGYKGLRYETHDGGEPIIASLSTPWLAHTWWPCKDGTGDKADSTYIDITIKDTTVNSFPLIAVSNGRLEGVQTANGKKTFQWRHRYPAVPYYLMVAISNYNHFQQTFSGPGYDFPIDYYVFDSHLVDAQTGMAPMPGVMGFFTEIFGPYPFSLEKYAMTQLGFYGGIENQTNTIVNKMSTQWFYTAVHELAHQWFADMITCRTWHHGWVNEGFASYAEALYAEHTSGFEAYQDYMANFEFFEEGTLYMSDISNPFTIFQTIIYDKGAYVLHMLRGVLGDDAFFDAIRSYATDAAFQYGHATTEDFQSVCEDVSGADLDYFFEQWVYDERYPVYSYNYVYHPATGGLDLAVVQTQGSFGWRPVFAMPMQIRVGFSDGTDTLVTVFNDAQLQYYSFSFDNEVENLALDTDKWILREVYFDPEVFVGTSEPSQTAVEVFPNPNTGEFSIRVPSLGHEIGLSVVDINGKVHRHWDIISGQGGDHEMEISGLENGVYFLHMISGEWYDCRKIFVVK